jgi:hypothetical protein
MSFIYKWIEGWGNLQEFCLKRFHFPPRFCETIGHCGPATIYNIYKYRDKNDTQKGCADMYLMFMEHTSGKTTWIELQEIMRWSYEQIRADKSSLLK